MGCPLTPGRGFSLVELLTVLALGLALAAGLLTLLRVQTEVVRRQSQRADLQQSLRIARHELSRMVRMAGRGGLAAAGTGGAATVRNNVAAGTRIGGPGTPLVAPGTDVLIVRGVFEGAVYEVAAAEGLGFGSGTVTVRRAVGAGGEQPLEPLAAAAGATPPEALLLGGPPGSGECAVAELSSAAETRDARGELAELRLELRAGGTAVGEGYRTLSEACAPLPPRRVRRAGVLEEYRVYVRTGGAPPGAGTSHQLARVRVYPGSDRAHRSSPRAGVPLVDHALDLQIALGIDLDGDGTVSEGVGDARAADEWLFNHAGDPAAGASWSGGRLGLVRLTLLLRAARAVRGHAAPEIFRLEDRDYDEPGALPDLESRLFQRARATATIRPRGG